MIGRFLRRRPSCSLSFLALAVVPRSASAAYYSSTNSNRNTHTSTSHTHRNMAPFITERDGKGTITVSPKNEADQSGLVVICHGLGDSAEGFADVAEVSTVPVQYLYCIALVLHRISISIVLYYIVG
jgi:hypothetical protein